MKFSNWKGWEWDVASEKSKTITVAGDQVKVGDVVVATIQTSGTAPWVKVRTPQAVQKRHLPGLRASTLTYKVERPVESLEPEVNEWGEVGL